MFLNSDSIFFNSFFPLLKSASIILTCIKGFISWISFFVLLSFSSDLLMRTKLMFLFPKAFAYSFPIPSVDPVTTENDIIN